jgi:predicted ATPase/DNA-binding SARP family transcriptional activator
VELCVFGPVEVLGSSGSIRFSRAKERAVLATLALFHGRAVSSDRLVDALWGDQPPARPDKALHTHVQRVRAALGAGVVETRSDGYALSAGVVVDVALFETEVREGSSAQKVREMLARWRGEPYVDLGDWPPAELERRRLAELREDALERCLGLEIEVGPVSGCVAELEVMVADKPLRERRWFLLMTALQREGRVADALRAYQRARNVFAEQLGIDPGPGLRALEAEILLDGEVQSGDLPRQLTSFVGRDREVAQLAVLVRDRSLVTLTGVGGVGKTRLALETAAAVSAEFGDGVWLCELAPVTNSGALWESLAASLKVPPSAGRRVRDVVLDYLAAKRLLLVVDNCEHLRGAVADLVDAVMQFCPAVVVVATSRERLGLSGEQIVAVRPLPVPTDDADACRQTDAVRLFCDRARDVNREFTLTDRNVAAVAQLCRGLDGMPLAIELAAARVRSLSVEDLVARLDQRLRLLTAGSRSAPERHRTLRNTIDWSYDLLTTTEQRALNRLSVFAGSFDLASAEAVVAADNIAPLDGLEVLSQLVDKSLVEVDITVGRGRYRLLETIRQYAHERLELTGETGQARSRHLARYVALAEEAIPHLRGRDQLEWVDGLARDADNFRAAFDWATEAELADEALRLVDALVVTGTPTNWTAADWPESVMAIPGASQHPLYPLAAAFAALGAALQVEFDHAATLVAAAQDAQTRLGTHHLHVHAAASVLALFQGDFDAAQHHTQTWVDLARASQDPSDLAPALSVYATTLYAETTEAVIVAEEAVRVGRDNGIPSQLLGALFTLTPLIGRSQPARAHALVDEAADVARKIGDQQAIATAVGHQARLAIAQQDWPAALRAATHAAEQHLHGGMSPAFGPVITSAAIALAHLHRLEPAAILTGHADARYPALLIDQEAQKVVAATDQLILDTLGATRTAELKALGATLANGDAVAYLRTQRDEALTGDTERPT